MHDVSNICFFANFSEGIIYLFSFCTIVLNIHYTISRSLSEGGTPARFLIIDDGWQHIVNEFRKEGEPPIEGTQ